MREVECCVTATQHSFAKTRSNSHILYPIMRKPKTIVIGSGLAGLSAALELSRNGFEVLLLKLLLTLAGEPHPGIKTEWK